MSQPELPKTTDGIRKAWLVNRDSGWLLLSRAGKVIKSFRSRETALLWWEKAITKIDENLRPTLVLEDRLTKKERNELKTQGRDSKQRLIPVSPSIKKNLSSNRRQN